MLTSRISRLLTIPSMPCYASSAFFLFQTYTERSEVCGALSALRREDAELFKSIKPWSKIVEPDPLRVLLIECGIIDPDVVAEPGVHPLETPEDWWTIILGSGYRSHVDALSPPDRERVRRVGVGKKRNGVGKKRNGVRAFRRIGVGKKRNGVGKKRTA